MEENKAVFETASVPKALAKLAIPTIIAQLVVMIYNVADTFFVGITNDPYKVAAISLSFVLVNMQTALSNLFGIGGSTLVSRLLGAHEYQKASQVSSVSFYGSIAVAAVYSIICFFFMDPLLRLLGASDKTISYSMEYTVWVVVIGGLPSILSMTMAHLLRSEGHAKESSFGLTMGSVLHIILAPIFMFYLMPPGKEVSGVAIATMISNAAAFLYYLIITLRLKTDTVLSLRVGLVPGGIKYLGPIISVGLPSALASLITSVANSIINKLMSGYGDIPVASMGIVKKLDMLPLYIGMGLSQGMMPLVAYNYSARNYQRMDEVISFSKKCAMIVSFIFVAVYVLFPKALVSVFIHDDPTIQLGGELLRICCTAVPFMNVNFLTIYSLQAMGKGTQSLLLACCRQGIINVPLLFLMNSMLGLYGVAWTQTVSDIITLILALYLYRRFTKDCTDSSVLQESQKTNC